MGRSNLIGAAFVMFATLIMALQDAIIKVYSTDLSLWQIFSVRSIISLLLLWLIIKLTAKKGSLRKFEFNQWVVLRSVFIVLMYVAFYASLSFLDLSVVAGAYYTGPLFIVILAAVLIKEVISFTQMMFIVLGFVGVLITLNVNIVDVSFVMVMPIFSAVFYAVAMIITKRECVDQPLLWLLIMLNFVFLFVGVIVSLFLFIFDMPEDIRSRSSFLLSSWQSMNVNIWLLIFFLSVLNIIIHFALASAYKAGDASFVACFDYSYLIFAVFWGWLLLSEVPTYNIVVGISLIAFSGLALTYLKNKIQLKVVKTNNRR